MIAAAFVNSRLSIISYLQSPKFAPAPIIRTDGRAIVLDLSRGRQLQGQDIVGLDVDMLGEVIDTTMREAGTAFAFGRYGEPRELYSNDDFYEDGEARTIHLGIDLFCNVDTPVYTPLKGTIELVANNDRELDYGPMVVVRHDIVDIGSMYTLYGHLSLDTLERVKTGQTVAAGEQIAAIGSPPGNGNWPPHLHMQVVVDMLGRGRNFPGVVTKSEQDYWFGISPSPAVFFPEYDASQLEYS
ncbi:MAG: hypothetical protein ACI88G_001877 [Woeseiaceae bacterium]